MLILAPMEGLLDFTLRDILTEIGGIDRCVAEFIRVTGTLLPERVFYRVVPELHHGGRTAAGVPVRVQLMGSDPVCLAENAARVATLSPFGVDLNFGCPAKIVNRHGGGAALLQDPELLYRIVAAVRRAVPPGLPVSAKMRLGFANGDGPWTAPWHWWGAVRKSSRCMPAPRSTAIGPRRTGNASPTFAPPSRCR